VDGGKYKDMIAARMKRKLDEAGRWTVYSGCDREYAEMVTAEHKINVKASNGSVVQRWVQKSSHADNHYLDCEVYALAAADIQGVRTLHLQAVPEEAAPAPQPEQPTPEESWISQNEDWLQE